MAPTLGFAGLLSAQYNFVGNVGGGLDVLHSYSLPANTLNVNGRGLLIESVLQRLGGAVTRLQLKFGSTVIFESLESHPNEIEYEALTTIRARVIRTASNAQSIFVTSVDTFRSGSLVVQPKAELIYATEVDTSAIVIASLGEDPEDPADAQVASHLLSVQWLSV